MKSGSIARRGAILTIVGAVAVMAMTFLTLDNDLPSGSTDACLNGTTIACGSVR